MFAVKETLNPGSMKEMNDSDSKSFACSNDLMGHVSKTTQLFQKSFLHLKLYPSLPKKRVCCLTSAQQKPLMENPVFERLIAHHVRAERAGSVAAEKVEEELHRAGQTQWCYEVRDVSKLTYCTLLGKPRRKCGS